MIKNVRRIVDAAREIGREGGPTVRQLAEKAGTSTRTLLRVGQIIRHGDQKLIDAVAAGEIAITTATGIIAGIPLGRARKTALYRHYDAEGELLYVGITVDPEKRFKVHARDSHWTDRAVSFTGEWFDSWQAAKIAETLAIRHERPLFNKAECPQTV